MLHLLTALQQSHSYAFLKQLLPLLVEQASTGLQNLIRNGMMQNVGLLVKDNAMSLTALLKT